MENWVQKNHLPLIFTSSSWVKMIPPGICSIKMNPAIHRKSHTWCQYSTTTPKFHWKKKKKNCYDLGKRFHGTFGCFPWVRVPDWGRGKQEGLGWNLDRLMASWNVADSLLSTTLLPLLDTGSPAAQWELLHLGWGCGAGAVRLGCSQYFVNSGFIWPVPVESPLFIGIMIINIKTTTNVCSIV